MSTLFTEKDSIDLAAEVEAQLRELREFKPAIQRAGEPEDKAAALVKQNETIKSLTQEPAQSFLAKFGMAAKADLCDADGLLHK